MFPTRRISPFDGMAVTAEVWQQAHDYHRQGRQVQALFEHGPGVLVGLEVVASIPADSIVHIRPGIAVDPLGQVIVLREPVAYDIGNARGTLYLLLSYGEGRPQAAEDAESGPLYVHDQFGIEAQGHVPVTACVELARIQRQDRNSPVSDATDPASPGANEIDLRFRREIGVTAMPIASFGVVPLGAAQSASHATGARHLARTLRELGPFRAWADPAVSLSADLRGYDLLYLVGQGPFQVGRDEMTALYQYLQAGGTLFYESCRRQTEGGDPPADASFADLLASLGIPLQPLPVDHALLTVPHLFAAPPPGFEPSGEGQISIGGLPDSQGSACVVMSTLDYGCLWRGERRDGPASREAIRSALEWGTNLVAFALRPRPTKGVDDA
ncbi:MAG: DUF4159 domain-containing protein [Anaerolineae bacterium]|nr:DUF4159 domain-containing protein [Anaerolineae bacterium]